MATLPAFFRRPDAGAYAEDTRRAVPARAERDPFQLRALPHEDVFFYCKKIDNSRLVREHDDRAHNVCWSAIGGAAVILVLLTGILSSSVAGTLAGYKLEALRSEERRLMDELRALDLVEAKLQRPDRLLELAKERNLKTPVNGQVVHLETGPDGAVAMVNRK
jgi:hypothetical protein